MTDADEPHQYGMFLDVETTGPCMHHHMITEIAFVLKDLTTGEVINSFVTYVPRMFGHYWDDTTLREFWYVNAQRYSETLEGMKRIEVSTPCIGIFVSLFKWLREAATEYDYTLFSDNPGFDVSWINSYAPNPEDNLYFVSGRYKAIVDTKSFMLGIARADPSLQKKNIAIEAGRVLGFTANHQNQLDLPQCTDELGNVIHFTHRPYDECLILANTMFHFLQRMKSLKTNPTSQTNTQASLSASGVEEGAPVLHPDQVGSET